MKRSETIYYLEMHDPRELRPAKSGAESLELRQAGIPCPELSRFFYRAVGGDWFWVDRLSWTRQQWADYVNAPHYELWIASLAGTPAGYFELDGAPGGRIEIMFFGLLPSFVGRGLGGQLLTAAVRRAWDKGAAAVWLHTCSFDHPHALKNYLARGFRVVREETHEKVMPGRSPGFWER